MKREEVEEEEEEDEDNWCSFPTNKSMETTTESPYRERLILLLFTNNEMVTPILGMYLNRSIKTMGEIINEINFPIVGGGFLNNIIILTGVLL